MCSFAAKLFGYEKLRYYAPIVRAGTLIKMLTGLLLIAKHVLKGILYFVMQNS